MLLEVSFDKNNQIHNNHSAKRGGFFMLKTHVMKLNTENANCFIYETEELLIELLGGVRVEGLDRMRVTIKVSVVNRKYPQYTNELTDLAIRHNLDLYNDTPHAILRGRAGRKVCKASS